MHDLNFFRTHVDELSEKLAARGFQFDSGCVS